MTAIKICSHDGAGIVVDVGGKLIERARELLQHDRRWPPHLPILITLVIDLTDEILQRAVGTNHVAMPEEPLHSLDLVDEGLLPRVAQASCCL